MLKLTKILDEQAQKVIFVSGHKNNELEKLGQKIFDILARKKMIDRPIKMENLICPSLIIVSNKDTYGVYDQPGHLGLEDQQMPYIHFEKNNSKIFSVSPNYFKRKFGDISMNPEMREKAYKEILDYFKKLK